MCDVVHEYFQMAPKIVFTVSFASVCLSSYFYVHYQLLLLLVFSVLLTAQYNSSRNVMYARTGTIQYRLFPTEYTIRRVPVQRVHNYITTAIFTQTLGWLERDEM